MKHKWITWVIVMTLAMTIVPLMEPRGAGAQGQFPPGEWQTYIDPTFGYRMSYPSGWEGRWMFDKTGEKEYVIRRRVAFFSPQGAEVDIDVWENRDAVTLASWLEQYREFLVVDIADDAVVLNHVVDGLPAAQFDRARGEHYPAITSVYLTNGKFVFRIAYSAFDGGAAADLYKEILSGFDITETDLQNEAAPTLPGFSDSPLQLLGDTSCHSYTNFRTSRWRCQYQYEWPENSGEWHWSAGNCTWWAAYKRPDVGVCIQGNADNWDNDASRCGYQVSNNPEIGAIAVIERYHQGTGEVGHVAYVEAVSDGDFYVSHMNWDNQWMSHNWFNTTISTTFILVTNTLPALGPFDFESEKEHGAWRVLDSESEVSKRDGEIIQSGISGVSGKVKGDSTDEWNEGLHYHWADFEASKSYRVTFDVRSLGEADQYSPYVLLKSLSGCQEKGSYDLDVGTGATVNRSIEVTLGNCNDYYLVFGERYAGEYLVDNVKCIEISNVDVALIIDATGSMDDNDPQEIRKDAAKAFIDAALPGDQIAVISFDTQSHLLAPLRTIQSQTDRDELKAAVDQVGSTGWTNLNAGLNAGFSELLSDTTSNNKKAAVFLTDGNQEGSGPYDPQSHLQYKNQGWPVYTVGLGGDTNPALLNEIATDTEGLYIALTDPNQLTAVYFEISQHLANGNIVLNSSVMMTQGSSQRLPVGLSTDQSSATFFIGWPGSEVSLSLTSPDGREIGPATIAPDVYHAKGLTYELYSIQGPEAGQWVLNLFGTSLPSGGEQVDIRVAVRGPRFIYLPVVFKSYIPGSGPTNQPPNSPANPSPSGGATDQSVNVNLSWTGGDPDGDDVTYDVYFEADDNTPDVLICNDVTSTSCDPGTLSYDTHYYWQIVATDEHGATTTGPAWRFDTTSSSGGTWHSYTNGNNVKALVVEGDYVWVGAKGGVLRWDRTDGSYVKYTNVDGLANNHVYAIAIDEAGHKWFGTDGGVSEFDGSIWTTYTEDDGLANNSVRVIAIDRAGHKWFGFGDEGDGVSEFDGNTWTTYTEGDGLAHDRVHAIAIDGAGHKWFGTSDGVSEFDGSAWTTYTTTHGLVSRVVFAIAIDGAGHKWFGTNEGVSEFDGSAWTTYTENDGLADNFVRAITIDGTGRKWFGTWSGGVSVFDGSTWTTYTEDDGLAHDYVEAIAIDGVGHKWFGTWHGVSEFDGSTWTTHIENNGPADNRVYAIAIDGAGHKWFGTGEGVSEFDGSDWTTYTYADGLAHDYVEAIAIDEAGRKWFGTFNGVSVFDGSAWTTYTEDDGLADNRVLAVTIDGAGHVWFGTYGGGVSKFDGSTWTTYTTADGLASNYVNTIAIDGAGHIWFGTDDGGVSEFDDSTWTTYTEDDGLVNNRVLAIAIDEAGHKWFGTAQYVSEFDGNAWTTYAQSDGVPSNWVEAIVIDDKGHKWFGTAGGVTEFDDNTWTTYAEDDGLVYHWVNAVAIDEAGHKWFGTYGGVSEFIPSQ